MTYPKHMPRTFGYVNTAGVPLPLSTVHCAAMDAERIRLGQAPRQRGEAQTPQDAALVTLLDMTAVVHAGKTVAAVVAGEDTPAPVRALLTQLQQPPLGLHAFTGHYVAKAPV